MAESIGEPELIGILNRTNYGVLIEPNYRRKYIPLGLAKISSYLRRRGAAVTFTRRPVVADCDAVFITSLFTSDAERVYESIYESMMRTPNADIIVGGVFASLCATEILSRFGDRIKLFAGFSRTLDAVVPDYATDWGVEDPWGDFSFTFTSRGCPNRCPYCAVWRIEPERWICPNWRDHIDVAKPNAMISDNNLSSTPEHLMDVCAFVVQKKKRVVFDNGLDCKLITPEIAAALARVRFIRSGLRMAFDRIEEDGVFQNAVETLKRAGVAKSSLMAYVLFNFKDTPKEANYRMTECVRLGVRPYPQKYEPLYDKEGKSYVGKHWTTPLLRAFRNFWLMAGLHTKMTFETWATNQEKFPLNEDDWSAWRKP